MAKEIEDQRIDNTFPNVCYRYVATSTLCVPTECICNDSMQGLGQPNPSCHF
jgi:hypothetical protein